MKRHESLIPLSRFHRSCLFLALIAKENAPAVKGYPTEINEKISYANSFFIRRLRPHFDREEKLWSFVANKSEELAKIVDELSIERTTLILLFQKLNENCTKATLHEMGTLLEKHVRKEERVLFQQIQKDLTDEELLHLQKVI